MTLSDMSKYVTTDVNHKMTGWEVTRLVVNIHQNEMAANNIHWDLRDTMREEGPFMAWIINFN